MDAQSEHIERLKSEIETLLLKHEKEKHVLLTSLEAAMVTIKQLREPDHAIAEDVYEGMIEIFLQQIKRRDKLIRELCDALQEADTMLPDTHEKIIQRARNAIT